MNELSKKQRRSVTLMVSSGCPASRRQAPATPPATKFFSGETLPLSSTILTICPHGQRRQRDTVHFCPPQLIATTDPPACVSVHACVFDDNEVTAPPCGDIWQEKPCFLCVSSFRLIIPLSLWCKSQTSWWSVMLLKERVLFISSRIF